jgi:hypothetical protein
MERISIYQEPEKKDVLIGYHFYAQAGVAQLVEHQPSKLRVAGSIPVSRSILLNLYF